MSLAMHLVCFASFLLLIHLPTDVHCATITTIGGSCAGAGDTCTTTPISICDATTITCLIDVGQSCTAPNEGKCRIGTSCDTSSFCKINVLVSCRAPNHADCKTGLVCDATDETCRLDVLQSCASPNTANCNTGLACDAADSKCRYKAGSMCATGVDRCVSGATCASVSAQCTCNTAAYTTNSATGMCEAIAKKVGGSCTAGTGACDDPNAFCNANYKCECKTGYKVKTADATCSGAMGLIASTFLLFAAFLVKHISK